MHFPVCLISYNWTTDWLFLCLDVLLKFFEMFRADEDWKKRYETTGFMPEGRPKRWRDKAMASLADAVEQRQVQLANGCV